MLNLSSDMKDSWTSFLSHSTHVKHPGWKQAFVIRTISVPLTSFPHLKVNILTYGNWLLSILQLILLIYLLAASIITLFTLDMIHNWLYNHFRTRFYHQYCNRRPRWFHRKHCIYPRDSVIKCQIQIWLKF